MSRKAEKAVCDRDCFNCIHPDCILDAGPNLDEYRLSAELDRIACLEAPGQEERGKAWRTWFEANREYNRERRRAYYRANREREKARQRAYSKAHRQEHNEWQRAYRASKKAERG